MEAHGSLLFSFCKPDTGIGEYPDPGCNAGHKPGYTFNQASAPVQCHI
jgi:hypothetical protein